MGEARFLVGVIALAAIVVPLMLAGISLRRLLVPGWSGAAARLAEIVLVLSLLILVVELVGVVGLYRPGFVIAGSVLASTAIILLCRRRSAPTEAFSLPAPPVNLTATVLAVAATVGVTYQWAFGTLQRLENGMYLANTTWHNAPFAARFVQEAQIGLPHFTDIYQLTVWFYPQNSELLNSIGILTLGTDVLSPALNIGWLLLSLLAAWVIGRPYGVGPAVIVAIALIFSTRMLIDYGAGEAKNDAMTLFTLLAALAFLINGEAQRKLAGASGGAVPWGRFGLGALILASLATGIAIGTRLNYLFPALALTAAVLYLSFRGQRLRSAGVWIGGLVLTSGFWYLRNLFVSGNPLPWAKGLGPIELPHPDQLPIDVREPGTVSEYVTNLPVIEDILLPQTIYSLGDLWFLVLGIGVVFAFVAIFGGSTRTLRTLGVVAALSFIGYLFTPLTAAGREVGLSGFAPNLRYVAPAVAIAMAIGPLSPLFRKTRGREMLLLGILLTTLVFTIWPTAPLIGDIDDSQVNTFRWFEPLPSLVFALVLVLVPVGLNALWSRRQGRGLAIAASIAAGLVVLGLSYWKTDNYVQTRYATLTQWRAGTVPEFWSAIQWSRELGNKRIGIVGSTVSFKQYFLYGNDLSNRVEYVGKPAANGGYRPIVNCPEFRRRVNDLDLDYLIIARYFRVARLSPTIARLREAPWVVGTPQARAIQKERGYTIFRLDGPLDPSTCPK